MKGCRFSWDRDRAHTHAVINLPPLDAKEALFLWDFLERVSEALWQVHGDAMADLLPDCLEEEPPDDDQCPYAEWPDESEVE